MTRASAGASDEDRLVRVGRDDVFLHDELDPVGDRLEQTERPDPVRAPAVLDQPDSRRSTQVMIDTPSISALTTTTIFATVRPIPIQSITLASRSCARRSGRAAGGAEETDLRVGQSGELRHVRRERGEHLGGGGPRGERRAARRREVDRDPPAGRALAAAAVARGAAAARGPRS